MEVFVDHSKQKAMKLMFSIKRKYSVIVEPEKWDMVQSSNQHSWQFLIQASFHQFVSEL